MTQILNIATYRFVQIDDPEVVKARLLKHAHALGLKGTILLAHEGINMFLAGAETTVRTFLAILDDDPRFADLDVKESWSEAMPFHKMKIKVKDEIVTFRQPQVNPAKTPAPFMSPEELKARLDRGDEIVLLDTRNDVEVDTGTFHGALFWGNKNFTEFGEIAAQHIDELKNKTVVSFCTGGIRCEKAAPFLHSLGVNDMYQLDSGLLRSFERVGRDHYTGDCFVFDERAAVDPALAPTPR
jgi:UPF0176 protein